MKKFAIFAALIAVNLAAMHFAGCNGNAQQQTAAAPTATAVDADYYVCFEADECNAGDGDGWGDGKSSNAGTSKSAPLSCPGNLESKLGTGDVAVIGDGTYNFSRCGNGNVMMFLNELHGNADNYIEINAENPCVIDSETQATCTAILDGQETSGDGDDYVRAIFRAEDCSYVKIDGFEMRNAQKAFKPGAKEFNQSCHHVELRGNRIHLMGFAGVHNALSHHDWWFDGNIIGTVYDEMSREPNHRCVHTHNIYWKGYNMLLTNNIIHDARGGGLITAGGVCSDQPHPAQNADYKYLWKWVNNTMAANGCHLKPDPAGEIRYNPIDMATRAFNEVCPSGTDERYHSGIIIRNNLFLGGQGGAVGGQQTQFFGSGTAEQVPSNPGCTHWPWAQNGDCDNNGYGHAGDNIFTNNIADLNYVLNPTHQKWATTYTDNKDRATGKIVANGSKEAGDFSLPADSIAINAGTDTDCPATDIRGTPRTDGGCDVGAFEVASEGGTDPGPEPEPDHEQRITTLETEVEALDERVTELENASD